MLLRRVYFSKQASARAERARFPATSERSERIAVARADCSERKEYGLFFPKFLPGRRRRPVEKVGVLESVVVSAVLGVEEADEQVDCGRDVVAVDALGRCV